MHPTFQIHGLNTISLCLKHFATWRTTHLLRSLASTPYHSKHERHPPQTITNNPNGPSGLIDPALAPAPNPTPNMTSLLPLS
jgi:hypothetical protein